MFLDRAAIEVFAGNGGDGCMSFRREKYVPRGGPDGGNGGSGGHVYLQVDPRSSTLMDFRYRRLFRGGRGGHGQGKDRTGRSGEDLMIPVPPGTVVENAETGEVLADLRAHGARFLLATGGRGGRGNACFATATNRAPRRSEKGRPGQQMRVRLELKLIADVGLVGFPNAGKSTFLSRVSEARPKVADYPFTTLAPHLGVVSLPGYRQMVVADIPGIIEGAHQGKGLGLEFLRHVERTRVLLFLVDPGNGSPHEQWSKLRTEIALHGAGLEKRPFLVALSKADLLPDASIPAELAGREDVRVISSVRGDGVDALLEELHDMVKAAKAEEPPELPGEESEAGEEHG
ncbi:MAG: GTPase ObgE [Gemmatimonadota bacterium]|jgi:GTP-binding protein|nr:GTPase ObgE [Gemmatimonadota bacterium]MDP6802187.1 GTPase ObgE [Gemmatimonadota bacterium]MDP7031517.1 GTPase ObgE [Gemmatimonadota bacterium]